MAALKGIDDADSAIGTVSDITGTGIATHSDDGGNIFTSGLGTDITDEFQVVELRSIIMHFEDPINANRYDQLVNDFQVLISLQVFNS